jgi:hypothetical protein
MDRREFLARAGLVATWALIPITISDCSDSSGPDDNPDDGDVEGVVTGGGHSHNGAVVTEAMITEGDAVTLTLTGSGHTHTVNLSAEQVVNIGLGIEVAVTSSTDGGHDHTVTFN